MAIAFVQAATIKTATGVGANTITSNSITTTAGNNLFLAASGGLTAGGAFNGITDSKGNTWTEDKNTVVSTFYLGIGSCVAPASTGAAHTVTQNWNNSGGDKCIAFLEYSGVKTSSALGAVNTATGTSTTPSTGAADQGSTSSLYLIAENNGGSPTITPAGGWNQRSENESGSSAQPLNVSDQINVSGSLNGGWTLGSSQQWVGVIATYAATVTTAIATISSVKIPSLAGVPMAGGKLVARALWSGNGIGSTGNRLRRVICTGA